MPRQDENLRILDLDLPGLYETQETPVKMLRGTFRDFTEWVKAADADDPAGSFAAARGGCTELSSHREDEGSGWAGTKSFDEALKLARVGWPEGLAEINKFIVKFESVIAGLLPVPEVQFDVTGDWLDIGRFLSGEPEDWGSLRDTEDTVETNNAKIVRLCLNMTANAGFDVKTIQRRGAACVALMHMLELTGRSCHLDIVEAATSTRRQEWYITVKRAGETLSPEQIAFAAVNGSMLRRFSFAVTEKMPEQMGRELGAGSSYGSAAQILRQEDYDIYMPALEGWGDSGDFSSEKKSIEWVLKTLRQQGIPIEEREAQSA